jgi:hypothetical protein
LPPEALPSAADTAKTDDAAQAAPKLVPAQTDAPKKEAQP